jgi:hypothetical protein
LTQPTDTKPWYRQFWPWFLIALPTAMIVISVSLFGIALEKPFSMVNKDYYQEGLTINKNLDELKQAAILGLRAELALADDHRIHVKLISNAPLDVAAVQLQFDHPIDGAQDLDLVLIADTNASYLSRELSAAEMQKLLGGKHWYVYLHADSNKQVEWMLQGEILAANTRTLTIDARAH